MAAPGRGAAESGRNIPRDESVDEFFLQLVAEYREKEAARDTQADVILVEDYTPLVDCLESELAEAYWKTVGVQAFAGNEVPFVINNDGRLSAAAAQVFFANCLESGASEPQIRVLEFGAGTGLFALFFLDAFQQICAVEGKDFYHRLTYYVSDGSPRTLEQWRASGQFAPHAEHVVIGRCDARTPWQLDLGDGTSTNLDGLRAVFANYILDVLPAAVVRELDGQPQQLCVRTLLEHAADPSSLNSEFNADDVRRLAASSDPQERAQLLPVLDALKFDTAFVPMNGNAPPYLEDTLRFGAGMGRILLNFGAIGCLENCLKILRDDGFIQVNDYGPTKQEDVARFGTATRFGSSIAMGVNFPLLEFYFEGRAHIFAPPDDEKRAIHSRIFTKEESGQTLAAFLSRFGHEQWNWDADTSGLTQARKAGAAGKTMEALEWFRRALEDNPGNWCLMGESAEFLIRNGDPANGIVLAKMAVERNPWYSSWLWNILGDGLYAVEAYPEAQDAYEHAAAVNPADVAANFNLSFVYARAGRHRDALEALSRALIHDFNGEYRERILEHQQQIMRVLSMRWNMQQMRRSQRAAAFE